MREENREKERERREIRLNILHSPLEAYIDLASDKT